MTGQYEHNLDAKGRLIVPAALRRELGEVCHVTLSGDHCLYVYSDAEWQRFCSKLDELQRKDSRDMRVVFANTSTCELDGQGRILIPQKLRDFAGIKKNVTFLGFSNHAEIWDRETYAAYEAQMLTPEKIAAIWDALPL